MTGIYRLIIYFCFCILQVWKLTGVGWVLAILCATPMFYVFRLNTVGNSTKCENIFRDLPRSHRQAFLTYAAIVAFLIPLVILIVCYVRIFMKIAQKAREHKTSKKQSIKPGKVQLQSTPSSSLPKAKIKTLKMTFVIVVVYIVCGLPYFVSEMIMSYGDHCIMSHNIYGLLGGIATANSSANPFVFLLFNANWKCIRDLKKCRGRANSPQKRYIYSSVNSRSEISTDRSNSHVYKWSHTKYDNVEMSSIN